MALLVPSFSLAQETGQPPADETAQLRNAVQQLYRYVQYLDGEVRALKQFIDAAVEIKLSFDIKERPSKGQTTAPVTILEFSDFQCPYCATFANNVAPSLDSLITAGKLKKVFMDLPLTSIHPMAFGAAKIGRCAQEQGKFWETHDYLFKNQGRLSEWVKEKAAPEDVKTLAEAVQLDATKLGECYISTKYDDAINRSMNEAYGSSISSTPTLVLGYTQPDGTVKVAKFLRGGGVDFAAEVEGLLAKLPASATPAPTPAPKGKNKRN